MNKLNFIVEKKKLLPSVLTIMNKITEISGYKFISRVVYIIQKNTPIYPPPAFFFVYYL